METTSMTLEGFFLKDYQSLRAENERLRAKVEELTNGGYGITDLGHPSDCVKVTVTSYHGYSTDYEGITSEKLREVLEMDGDELWRWANGKYKHVKTAWYTPLMPVVVEHKRFQYTLRITETRGSATFVTDADPESDGSVMYVIKDWEGEECLECWQDEARFQYIKQQAIDRLRYNIDRAIDRLEESE